MGSRINTLINHRDAKISASLRSKLVILLFFLATCLDIFIGTKLFSMEYRWYYLFSAMLFTALTVLYADSGALKQKPRKIAFAFWMLPWAFFFVNTVFVSTNFLPIPVLALFFMPLLYWVFPKEKEAELFLLLTRGGGFAFSVFIVLSLLFRPFIGRSYVGVFTNANYMGRFAIIIFALLLAGVCSEEYNKATKYRYLLLGFSLVFMLFSLSRTAWLSCFAVFVVFLFVQLFKSTKQSRTKLFQIVKSMILGTLLATMLLFLSTALFFDNQTGLSKIGLPQLKADGYELLIEEPAFPWEYRFYSFGYRFAGNILPKHIVDAYYFDATFTQTDVGAILNDFSSNRLATWHAYMENIDFFAKPASERPYTEGASTPTSNAHNTFFELAFIGGLVTAVCFVLLKVYMFLLSLKLSLRYKEHSSYLHALFIVTAVTVSGVFASIYSPSGELFGTMFYLAIIPIFNHLRQRGSTG